jgi:hypothetical protein
MPELTRAQFAALPDDPSRAVVLLEMIAELQAELRLKRRMVRHYEICRAHRKRKEAERAA